MSQSNAAALELVLEYEEARRELVNAIKAIEDLEAQPESGKHGLDYENAFSHYHACRARCKAGYLALDAGARKTVAPPPKRGR
jgi:hypothetical protein